MRTQSHYYRKFESGFKDAKKPHRRPIATVPEADDEVDDEKLAEQIRTFTGHNPIDRTSRRGSVARVTKSTGTGMLRKKLEHGIGDSDDDDAQLLMDLDDLSECVWESGVESRTL